jgi:hypothetical protein
MNHNLAIVLLDLPSTVLSSRPTNLSCHNLCTFKQPPKKYSALLGLGFNFCLTPRQTNGPNEIRDASTRFLRDVHTKMFFAHMDDEPWDPKQLFIRSDWEPDPAEIPREFQARVSHFLRELKSKFRTRRVESNLTPLQTRLLQAFKNSDDFIVFPSDKNLGPALLERSEYINRALKDHLADPNTYQRLTEADASAKIAALSLSVEDYFQQYRPQFTKKDYIYLIRSLEVDDPFPHFYITAKVHKTPWKTRPIVSVRGSILHGLGKWIDRQLQPICRQLPSYLKSSYDLKKQLSSLTLDAQRTSFFTADAVSMYTNIDTEHALSEISNFLRTSPLCHGTTTIEATIHGLEILMRNNLFKFGDTAWLQLTGTAMGTPPACMYATLYFAIYEMELLTHFESSVAFYRRYIDDCFGIWNHHSDPEIDEANWLSLKVAMQAYGSLEWEFTERRKSADFLDLTISIKKNGTIRTKLFEKELNLYLYIPPHSAHPPGVLRGLITGMLKRIYRLTTDKADKHSSVIDLFHRLLVRGHQASDILPMFKVALVVAAKPPPPPVITTGVFDTAPPLFFHLPFHPRDVTTSKVIQETFRSTLAYPKNEPALSDLRNRHNGFFRSERLIVAYHRPYNLRNVLFPRKFKAADNQPVSSFLPTMR